MREKKKLDEALKYLKRKLEGFKPEISITLGSGLDSMTSLLKFPQSCSYKRIPYCPVPTATGHHGYLWWGYLNDVPVIMLEGRVHLYEGCTVDEVVFLPRLMVKLGVEQIILTQAVGAMTRNLEPGDIVGIRSHIGFDCPDPTAGKDAPALGTEFTPMGDAYSQRLLSIAKKSALKVGVSFHLGVEYWKKGRAYETSAEVENIARDGADVGGMSTVPEAIAAVHMGVEVLALALVTNMGAGLGSSTPLSHDEVKAMAEKMGQSFGSLISAIVRELNSQKTNK